MSVLLAASFAAMPGAGSALAEDMPIVIVCTNSALADFTVNVLGDELGDKAGVEYIMPAGVCPSHFDTSPSDVSTISSADIVISLGWEPWLSDLLESSDNDDVSEIECIGFGEWNYPEGAEKHIDKIASGLSEFNADWEDIVTSNAENYTGRIEAAYEAARLQVMSLGLDGTKVIAIEWYEVFLEGLGFQVAASYGPPEGLSTADIFDVTEACGDPDVAMVVDNFQSTIDFGAELAFDYAKAHVVLSNFPGAIPGRYTYLENMEYNIEELVNGATTYRSTQKEISDLESEVSSLEFQRLALISAIAVLSALLVISAIIARRKAR
ncbi:MAG: zinc ABC transporter substrate-binding protein [Methanobacteriota archaeon]|nr:MAG: zinc ABC transporter substrate-binding protein [Euryarchaeota archaeon]